MYDMKWIKDAFADAKAIITAPVTNILCFGGILLLLGSFIDYDETQGFSMHGNVHWIMAGLGLLLVLVGVVLFLLTRGTIKGWR